MSTAHPPLTEAIRPTTLIRSPRLQERLGVDLTIASETFQYTGSFKFRAAYNLARSAAEPHVITASSGNFGQALAYACRLTGKACTVVMPGTSARVKIDAVREYGATVDLIDVRAIGRAERVAELALAHPDAYIASAYDDDYVIQGNSSLGDELCTRRLAFDAIVAPVGGGGLTAGLVLGRDRAGARTAIVGAEPQLGNDAARSLREGRLIRNEAEPQTIADGARTISLGERNFAILRSGLEAIVEVPDALIEEGVRLLFGLANLKAEPTGALSIGALLADPARFRGKRVCCVISGGNVDPGVYVRVVGGG